MHRYFTSSEFSNSWYFKCSSAYPNKRKGHSSLIAEAAASLGPNVKPGAVLISVGGGGLLCGVVQGLKDVGWMDVPIVAMETVGADCLNASVKTGRIVTLDDITRSNFFFEPCMNIATAHICRKKTPSSCKIKGMYF